MSALLDTLLASELEEQLCPARPATRLLRVGIYCRISADDEKDNKGVGRQTADCRRLQAERYPNVAGEPILYVDNDVTAMGKKVRTNFERLLRDMRAGKLDVVIMWHTDRAWRRIEELSRIMDAWTVNRPEIAAVTVGLVDFTTPTGRFLARVMAIVGQYEVEHLIERCLRKKRELREEGKVQGGPRPFGYKPRGYELDPRESKAMKDAARRILVGEMTVYEIAAEWNREGLTTSAGGKWTGTAVRRIMTRWRNVAIVEHDGKVVGPALWEAVFDEETFMGLRAALGAGRAVRKYRPHVDRLLSAIARCGECGAVLHGGGQSKAGTYRYRCSVSNHLSRAAEPIEQYVEDVVVGILSRPEAVKLLGTGPSEDRARELYTQAAAKKAKLEEANQLYVAEVIDGHQLADISKQIRQGLADIEAALAQMATGSVLDGVVSADAAMVWETLPMERRRAIIEHLLTITVHRGRRGGGAAQRAERALHGVVITPKRHI